MTKATWTVLILIFITCSIQAQDKNFSQFYASPLTLNPALTGHIEGRYRAGINYRDQWRQALGTPFQTVAGYVDLRFPILRKQGNKDFLGTGILFFNDKVSGTDFSTTQMALSVALNKSLDQNATQYLSLGVQVGLTQRNVNLQNQTFGDQFNGVDKYSFPTGEDFPENNFGYGDLHVGLNYSAKFNKRSSIFVGGAIHHILEPNVSFYKLSDSDNSDLVVVSKLYRKYSTQVNATLAGDNGFAVLPRLLFAIQGPHWEMNAGSNFRFRISDVRNTALHLGGWVRPARNESKNYYLDALVMMVGIEFNSLLIGLSYDTYISDIARYRKGQGAFELSIGFTGEYENEEENACPKF